MSGNTGTVTFRPEIEGLRGLLVLLVIIFHAGVEAFEGVYFSVDIFFVLSGYLMALIISTDINAGRFSIMGFYERRARRLFPALYVVVFSSLFVAYVLLPAAEYEEMAESALWVLGLAGNLFFSVSSSSYFDSDMGLQPFMHLWTLGLEQQYYLLIPLLFALCVTVLRRVSIHAVLVVLVLGSFGVALSLVYSDVQSAFYLPFSRFWEFALGSLLALNEAKLRALVPGRLQPWLADIGAVAVAVVFSIATVYWVHPGPATLVPVLGSLLFLGLATRDSIFSRLLSIKPLLHLGAISYSLYLWHQVFFAFARWYSPLSLTGLDYFSLTVGAVLLSVVTYHLVEAPFRNRRAIVPKAFWIALALCTVPLYFTAKYVDRKHGVEERLPAIVQSHYQAQGFGDVAITADNVACYDLPEGEPCPIGDPAGKRSWMLVGDSHAAALTSVMDRAFRAQGVAGYAVFKNACALAVGSRLVGDRERQCERHNARLMDRLLQEDIEGVVITGRYPAFLDSNEYDNGEGGVEEGMQWWYEPLVSTAENPRAAVLQSFVDPVQRLLSEGKKVVLVYPVPEMGWSVPHYQFKRLMRDQVAPEISISLQRYRERIEPVAAAFDALGERENLVRIKPEEIFCDAIAGRCFAQRNGRLLYRDDDHVNDAGAALLVSGLMMLAFGEDSLSNRIVTRF